MISQYTKAYLDENIYGRFITPGSYLTKTLRGRAKHRWLGRYEKSLRRSLALVGAKAVPSMRGGTAYIHSVDSLIYFAKR